MTDGLTRRAGSALAWRTASHVGTKVVYLVRIPILARLLAPDDFGLMAIALVALDILMRVTDVGMIPALVQRDQVDARHYDVAWSVTVVRALIVAAVVVVAAPPIASLFGEPRAVPIMRGLAVRPVLDALASIKVADLTRELRFKSLAFLQLGGAVLNAGLSIALAPFYGVWALVFGALGGATAYGVLSYVLAPYLPRIRFDSESAGSLLRFGRWIFVIGLTALASRFILQAVISRQLGTVELGLYYLAARIAYLPTEVSEQLIGSVAFPLYSRLQEDAARAAQAFRALLTGMTALLLPAMVLLIVLAPSLVRDLLGDGWAGTVPVIQVLTVSTMVGMYGDALVPIFKGWGQPWRVAVLVGLRTAILVAFIWGLTERFGLPGAVAAWIPATAATQIAGFVFLRRMIPGVHRGLGRPLTWIVGTSLAAGLLALWLDRTIPGFLGLFVGGAGGWFMAGFVMLKVDVRYGLGLVDGVERLQPRLGRAVRRVAGTPA